MCGETPIIQSKDFQSLLAVQRFFFPFRSYLPTWKCNMVPWYQAFQVVIKCTVCMLSSNGVLSLNKLSLVHEAVRYLVYSEVTQKKMCYDNKYRLQV